MAAISAIISHSDTRVLTGNDTAKSQFHTAFVALSKGQLIPDPLALFMLSSISSTVPACSLCHETMI